MSAISVARIRNRSKIFLQPVARQPIHAARRAVLHFLQRNVELTRVTAGKREIIGRYCQDLWSSWNGSMLSFFLCAPFRLFDIYCDKTVDCKWQCVMNINKTHLKQKKWANFLNLLQKSFNVCVWACRWKSVIP